MERKERVLLIEDQEAPARAYARAVMRGGFDVDVVHSEDDALRRLNEKVYEAAIVDMSLSGVEGDISGGERIINYAHKVIAPPALIVFTAYTDTQFAADTIQEGRVARFVSKENVIEHGAEPLLHALRAAIDSTSRSRRDRPREILRVLAGSEQEDIWIDGAFRRTLGFRGGHADLLAFLDQLVGEFVPLIPGIGLTGPRLSYDSAKTRLVGNFWSKGVGAAIRLEVYAAAALIEMPIGHNPSREHEHSGLRGIVWPIPGAARGAYEA
jgi:ActR/RegA family two-component response regulator